MIRLQRILFPIAFSKAAESMALSVRGMAERFNATVTVLNAFNPLPEYFQGPSVEDCSDPTGEPSLPYSPELLELRDQQKERLQRFSQSHFSGMNCSARIEDGDPAMVIEWVAKCEKADLIMMPTRGLGKFRHLLLGSVTSKILHDTSFPLWTSVHKPELASALPLGCRSILCAVGLNQGDDAAFTTAHLFARTYDAPVCLLHIQAHAGVEDQQSLAQSIGLTFDEAGADNATRSSKEVRVRIQDGEITERICQTAVDEHADLLILGRGRARDSFAQVWSHLYAIIRESPCPVLSV
jgi:nucleotide-binding universal stress UspA family protein